MYKRNFLNQVIFRIDYAEVKLTGFDAIKENVKLGFDKQEKTSQIVNNFVFNPIENIAENNQDKIDVWVFVNSKTNNKMEVGPDHILLEYFSYTNSSQLIKDIEQYCSNILSTLGIQVMNRVGLRYINEIKLSSVRKLVDWKKHINADLIAPTLYIQSLGNTQNRFLTQSEFITNSDCAVSLRYGVWNPNYPSSITDDAYILDVDSFTRLPIDIADQTVSETARQLNKCAETIFEQSITDNLRKEMEK